MVEGQTMRVETKMALPQDKWLSDNPCVLVLMLVLDSLFLFILIYKDFLV